MIKTSAPIGIFDSGYGGLTVFKSILEKLPNYDFIYLGDNARAPYGNRSFEQIYQYTWQAVQWLFEQGCPLIILACNTASAKALRNIQQLHLQNPDETRRVLGVIRPTSEHISEHTTSRVIGVLGTEGTITSNSYPIEIAHFAPDIKVLQQSCPMWVPIIEDGESKSEAALYYVKKYLSQILEQDKNIDALLLACTHYPILQPIIEAQLPPDIEVVTQGDLVARSLENYLQRHPEMDERLTKNQQRIFYTTGSTEEFDIHAAEFFGEEVSSIEVNFGQK